MSSCHIFNIFLIVDLNFNKLISKLAISEAVKLIEV